MLEGFETHRVEGVGAQIHLRLGGDGPPLLLLHGYPQTHLIWHRVAPLLSRHFTLILPDLRGYGASDKPPSDPRHESYSKRAMAADMAQAMRGLGFARFMMAGHDRGGRVAHRLCLDHPDAVSKVALLDIVPTRTLFEATDMALALAYEHWFFLAQPAPLPERLIGADPAFYLETKLTRWSGSGSLSVFAPEALTAYRAAFGDPAVIAASCEDYRAGATIDLAHDHADEQARIACPVLALWGERGLMHRHFDVAATWRSKSSGTVEGRALACGHFLPEEAPDETAAALLAFFLA